MHTKNDLLYTQGSLQYTERNLDFAIEGDGFFKLEDEDGEYSYTRAGIFNISTEGGSSYLVAGDGSYVLDKSGQRIEIPKVKTDSDNGTNVLDYGSIAEKIGVYSFDNPFELMNIGDLKLKETELSGENQALGKNSGYQLVQGAYENSTTDIANEMTHLMETQKAYQFSAKIVQTADQIEEIVNTLR
ncbi:MAG: flagellar basal body rod C-terminal domain-containing protein [Oscillospiraceae bacterium]